MAFRAIGESCACTCRRADKCWDAGIATSCGIRAATDAMTQAANAPAEEKKIRDRNGELETEMAKVAGIGKKEEIEFAEDLLSWPEIWISDELTPRGDYLVAFRDGAGNALDPKMVVDNKDTVRVRLFTMAPAKNCHQKSPERHRRDCHSSSCA
jgi:hypothetical protein